MASITTRAGKGSPLTNAEVDANFTNLNTELGQKLVASNLTPYLTSATAASTYQPLDADLTSIAGLAGTSGFLKKTAANTWALDTNTYLTGNQSITFTGDATGSGATSVALTLANSGVTAGVYTKVTVDAKGRVTTGASLSAGDIPSLSYLPLSGGTLTGAITIGGGGDLNLQAASGSNDPGDLVWRNGAGTEVHRLWDGGTGLNYRNNAGAGYLLIHAGNYSSYALPLSGGTVSGNLYATSEIRLNAANTARIAWRPAGSGTLALGLPFALNPATGAINIEASDNDTGGLMIDNEGVTAYGAGDTGYVFRVIDEDQYQSNGNSVANATQFWVGQDSGASGFRNQLTIAGNTALHAGNYSGYSSFSGTVSSGSGFQNAAYYSGRNRIWSFGNADSYGISYFQGGGGYGGTDSVGIHFGTTSADCNFIFRNNSDFIAKGNVTAYSDEHLKKDWALISDDFVERLALVKSGTYTRTDSGERQAGSSAQDWQKLLPEVVTDGPHLALAYGNAALVSAIELAKRVVRLEAQIAKLIGD